MSSDSSLPDFRQPPVVETILGAAFRPVGWSVPHFGLFWDSIRDEYPTFEVRPAVPGPASDQEAEGSERPVPPLRCWFLEEGRSRLLQIQHNRFLHNWRKVGPNSTYPHYEPTIRPAFRREWERFVRFLSDADLSPPDLVTAEVTYVNQFEKGREWEEPEDLPKILRFVRSTDSHFLSSMRSMRSSIHFEAPALDGRIEVDLSHAVRNSDMKEVFQLNVSAKGRPADSSAETLMQWMDRGREHVVKGFVELTTPEAHKIWERIA